MSRETNREIGSHFGGIGPAAASLASKWIKEKMKRDAGFKGNLAELVAKVETKQSQTLNIKDPTPSSRATDSVSYYAITE